MGFELDSGDRMKTPSLWIFNIFGRARASLVKRYLKATVRLEDPAALMSWQPAFLIALKTAAVLIASLLFYRLRFLLGGWLEKGFAFFKLSEIYNFQFPGRSFFDRIGGIVILIVICYYGAHFLIHQLQALCSSLVVSVQEGKLYYIRSFFVKKDLFVFPMPETDMVVLKQNAVSRFLGIGTIIVREKNGDRIEARGLMRPEEILKRIVSPEAPRDRSGFAIPGE
jgi:hypothetical protein